MKLGGVGGGGLLCNILVYDALGTTLHVPHTTCNPATYSLEMKFLKNCTICSKHPFCVCVHLTSAMIFYEKYFFVHPIPL